MVSQSVRFFHRILLCQQTAERRENTDTPLSALPAFDLMRRCLVASLNKAVVIFVCMFAINSANAQPLIEELERLNFGVLAVAANSSVSRFTYPSTGNNLSVDGQIVVIALGLPGSYRVSGFPPFTSLDISLDNTSLTAGEPGIPELLDVDSYDVPVVVTDGLGRAEFSLGARLSTSGSGNSYVDAIYNGITTLRIEYWQPDISAFVFNSTTINLETELRSTVTMSEEQELQFGTLFARTSSTDQASINLLASGTYTINESGDSRLVVLVRPEQGVVKVSGAAPFYDLTITPQSTDVLLQHADFPGTAPHFILSSLVTLPAGAGRTDENGELIITIGGTLKTEVTASPEIYPDGEYEGTYDFVVSY